MDENFRLTRHTNLWEEQNKQVKRTIIASLIFCVLLLMNVLKPYSSDLDTKRDIRTEIAKYKKENSKIETSIVLIDDFKQISDAAQLTIKRQPWMGKKNDLVETLAQINNRGEGNWTRYQKEADDTVRAIGAQVDEMVVMPLNEFLLNYPQVAELMPELYTELKIFPTTIQKWVDQNLGKRWYRTLDSKMARVESLSRSLEVELDTIDNKIHLEKPNLVKKRNELRQEITRLENETDIQAKEELLEILEARMEMILPEWVRGLISVNQMIQYYPLIILSLVMYVIAIAFSLNSHYQAMSTMRKITTTDRVDPIFSSLWTLTYRGRMGTILTIISYISYVGIMWILFEMGSDIFAEWLIEKDGDFIGNDGLMIIRWIGRFVLIAAVCFVTIRPYYHKGSVLTETQK